MKQTKRVVAVTALAAAGVVGSAGLAAAAESSSGASQADTAPHSTAPVKQTGVANFNGDTTVIGIGELLAPVNVPVGMAKTGAEQVANEHASPQSDAPVLGMGGSPQLRSAMQKAAQPKAPEAPKTPKGQEGQGGKESPAPKPQAPEGKDGQQAPGGDQHFPKPGAPEVGIMPLLGR